ncbi:MAG: prolyl oligopeptidase family serine peptidase [Verrucomicrobiota bacterium]
MSILPDHHQATRSPGGRLQGSRHALSWENITRHTPPMFIAHLQGDTSVPCENSLKLYAALTSKGVSATLHIYQGEGHGFGLAANHAWGRDLLEWLDLRRG